jgi:hypothetical protein
MIEKMKGKNTFGVHFILRLARSKNGKAPIYARIVVNTSRVEITIKAFVDPDDWNDNKGAAKPKNEALRELNNYLEDVKGNCLRTIEILRLMKSY